MNVVLWILGVIIVALLAWASVTYANIAKHGGGDGEFGAFMMVVGAFILAFLLGVIWVFIFIFYGRHV